MPPGPEQQSHRTPDVIDDATPQRRPDRHLRPIRDEIARRVGQLLDQIVLATRIPAPWLRPSSTSQPKTRIMIR